MAINNLNPRDYDFADEEPVKSNAKRASEFLLGLGTRAAQGSLNMAEAPSQVSQRLQSTADKHLGFLPERNKQTNEIGATPSEPLSQKLETAVKSKFGESSIEPENILSRGAQIAAENLPGLIASVGTSSIPQILSSLPLGFAKSIPGAVGYAATEKHTDNPVFKLAASFLADKGFKNLSGFINGKVKEGTLLSKVASPKEASPLNKAKGDLYKQRDISGKDIKADTNPLREGFKEVERKLSLDTGPDIAEKKEILDKIKTINRRFTGPRTTAKDLSEAKVEANKLFDQWSDKNLRKYFTEIRDVVENQLEDIGKSNPEWNKIRKVADEIHTLQNWQPNLVKAVSSWIPSGKIYKYAQDPLTQGALVALTTVVKGAKLGALAAAPLTIKGAVGMARAGKFLNYLGSTKQGQKILFDIAADSAKGSEAALIKSIHAMNKQADKYEKLNPDDYEFDLNSNDYEFAD